MFSKNETRLIEKQDVVHLAILIAIALAIGVYLIVTTVLISNDGMYYILKYKCCRECIELRAI